MAKQNENSSLQVVQVKKTYLKGYQTKELIAALDMTVIRDKNKDALSELETALGVRHRQEVPVP